MAIRHVGRIYFLVLDAALLFLFASACAQQPQPSVTGGSPIPTEVVVATPSAAPLDESGLNSPDPQSLPEVPAPLGLANIRLPDDAESVDALFNSLPPNLMGNERTIESAGTGSAEIWASYGNTQPVGCGANGIKAVNVSTGDFFPQDWTAERVVAVFAAGADWEVEDFGRDGDLFWVRWNTTCSMADAPGKDSIFTASWGTAGSPWFFSVSAGDLGGRDVFTSAFVAAAK
jgi:hypothetical protein